MTDPVEAIRRDIEQELGRLKELLEEAAAVPEPRDNLTKRALASIVHDVYTCCERIFRRIALDLDGHLPEEPGWHRRLLSLMASDLPGVRPAVISKDVASSLDEYLGFRHVFRNVYGFELEGERLLRLVRGLPSIGKRVAKEVRRFLGTLEEESKG
jgi:hypothetical protein